MLFKSSHFPGSAVAVKRGSPLILGIKVGENSKKKNVSVAPMNESNFKLNMSGYMLAIEAEESKIKDVEYFFSSDVNAIVEHTKTVVFMQDGDVVHIQNGMLEYYNLQRDYVDSRDLHTIEMELDQISKGKYEHFMLKEIHEQEESVLNTMRGRINFSSGSIKLGGVQAFKEDIKFSRRLIIVACGTSYHSGVAVHICLF